MSKFTEHKVTVIQGVLGDIAVDQLGWLSKQEQLEFWRKHEEHVKDLKEKNEYLKPLELHITLQEDELYDKPQIKSQPIESYRMTFLDLTT